MTTQEQITNIESMIKTIKSKWRICGLTYEERSLTISQCELAIHRLMK